MEPRLFKIKLPDGQDSAPFDSNALISYARAGHIAPGTWVFDIQQGRWMAAQQAPELSGFWGGGAPSPYARRPVATNKSSSVVVSIIAGGVALLFFGFLLLRPVLSKLTDSGPPQTVTTPDGFYSIQLPSSWQKYPDAAATAINYTNIGNTLAVRVSHLNTGSLDINGVKDLSGRMAVRLQNNKGWVPVGSQQTVSAGKFVGISQAFTQQKGLVTYNNHIILISTPNGIYDFIQVVSDGDSNGQAQEDKALSSFKSTVGS